MVIRFTPLLCAALAAVIGFYYIGSLPFTAMAVTALIALTAHCAFRALASLAAAGQTPSAETAQSARRKLKQMEIYSAVFLVGLCAGICASSAARNEVRFGIPENKITALKGVLLEDPRIIAGGRAIAAMSLMETAGKDGVRVKSSGELTVFFPEDGALKIREFGRGTVVFTEGRLRSSNMGLTYSAQSMHIAETASSIDRMRTNIRLNLIDRFEGTIWGGFALALLVGIKDNLDTNLSVMYRDTGLSHILALSGLHLAVIAALIAFLLKRPLGLKPAAITGAVIILLYCYIVGPLPSLNRSAIMYLIGVLAVLGALPREPMSILGLSFLLQIIIAPAEGNTISFILSYLALAGIFIAGQPLYSLFCGKLPDFLLQPLSASCGAFLATAGVTSFSFKTVIPMGIITGLALVPLSSVFLIGSIIWLVLDLVSLSFILDMPLKLLYLFMEKIVAAAVHVPGIHSAPVSLVIALSAALSLLVVILEYRRRTVILQLKKFR